MDGELIHVQMIRDIDPRTQEEIDSMKKQIESLKEELLNLKSIKQE